MLLPSHENHFSLASFEKGDRPNLANLIVYSLHPNFPGLDQEFDSHSTTKHKKHPPPSPNKANPIACVKLSLHQQTATKKGSLIVVALFLSCAYPTLLEGWLLFPATINASTDVVPPFFTKIPASRRSKALHSHSQGNAEVLFSRSSLFLRLQ